VITDNSEENDKICMAVGFFHKNYFTKKSISEMLGFILLLCQAFRLKKKYYLQEWV